MVLPYLVGFIVLGVEVIGDVTATAEVSGIQTAGPTHRRRIQGALFADGVNCFFSALAMTLPVTTFAQNNGVSLPTTPNKHRFCSHSHATTAALVP